MNIITLKTIDSTNSYLKNLIHTHNSLPNFLTVYTPHQTAGVGQYGAKWTTEPFQNLTFSTLFLPKQLSLNNSFLLNMLVPIAVIKILESLTIPQLNIKWPNDILSKHHKIGGILIENSIQGNYIEKSIIGIGLNVNQTTFKNLPKASSLKKITGKNYDTEEIMKLILSKLEELPLVLTQHTFEDIYPTYQKYLFQLNKVSAFRPQQGKDFSGIIRGIQPSGKLIVENEEGVINNYWLKELTLLY